MIAAQQYFIEFGTDINMERIFTLLPSYIPDYCLANDRSLEKWATQMVNSLKKVGTFRSMFSGSIGNSDEMRFIMNYAKLFHSCNGNKFSLEIYETRDYTS